MDAVRAGASAGPVRLTSTVSRGRGAEASVSSGSCKGVLRNAQAHSWFAATACWLRHETCAPAVRNAKPALGERPNRWEQLPRTGSTLPWIANFLQTRGRQAENP